MRWVWHLIYGYLAIQYLVTSIGVLWDDWRLNTGTAAYACFMVAFWATEQIARRELKFREGE